MRRRSHFVTVIDNTWKVSIGFILYILLQFVFGSDENEEGLISFVNRNYIYFILAITGIFLLIFITQLISWLLTWFYIDETSVNLEKRGLFKRKLTIPLDKVSTVDIGKNILGHLTGTSRVKIDSGSVNKYKRFAEISLIFDDKSAKELRHMLLNKKTPEIHLYAEYKMSLSDFVKYGILERKIIPYILSLLFLVPIVIEIIGNNKFNYLVGKLDIIDYKQLSPSVIIQSVSLLLIYILIINIYSIIKIAVKYYNFSLRKEENTLIVEYGLFNKKVYSLPLNKIRALTFSQNFLCQLTGYSVIKAVCAGLGDEKKEEALLFPFASKMLKDDIIANLMPHMMYDNTLYKVPAKGVRYFFFIPMIMLFIIVSITITASLILDFYPVFFIFGAVLITILSILNCIMEWKNTGFYYTSSGLRAVNGSFMKYEYRITMSSIQSIKTGGHIFKRRRGICSYRIAYYAGSIELYLRNLDSCHFDLLADMLDKDIISFE